MLIEHMKWKGAAGTGALGGMYALAAVGMDPVRGATLDQLAEWSTAGALIGLAGWAAICITQGYRGEENR